MRNTTSVSASALRPTCFAPCRRLAASSVAALLLSGCGSIPRIFNPAAATVTAGASAVTQTGTAEVPASAEVVTDTRSVPLPSGTEIIFDEALGTVTLRLSQATTLATTTRTERATAPRSYAPPAPPTPVDEAQGRAALLYRLGLVLGGAAGVFGLVRGWDFVMWGGGAVAAGCALGIWLDRSPAALAIVGGGCAFAIAGVIAWHFKVKPALPSSPPRDAAGVL